MELSAVKTSYARWAPIYDKTFGILTEAGRKVAVDYINQIGGSVLEVGVGTGLSLEHYGPQTNITGIDFSDDMLAKAKDKVQRLGLGHVKELRQMDARVLDFPDASFELIAAMHVLSVVPEPERVMAEIARVLRPGGKLVVTNHFEREGGVLGKIEKLAAPFSATLGWHSDFRFETILQEEDLTLVERKPIPPIGVMTFAVLEKSAN